ncbi:hypothetical protein DFS34DRAFT_652158 [Phlyctochytrium arcticum]|nr:hypothetical protein DFS34DRAFT_652158 [Phlyctochytrium arcticum]
MTKRLGPASISLKYIWISTLCYSSEGSASDGQVGLFACRSEKETGDDLSAARDDDAGCLHRPDIPSEFTHPQKEEESPMDLFGGNFHSYRRHRPHGAAAMRQPSTEGELKGELKEHTQAAKDFQAACDTVVRADLNQGSDAWKEWQGSVKNNTFLIANGFVTGWKAPTTSSFDRAGDIESGRTTYKRKRSGNLEAAFMGVPARNPSESRESYAIKFMSYLRAERLIVGSQLKDFVASIGKAKAMEGITYSAEGRCQWGQL